MNIFTRRDCADIDLESTTYPCILEKICSGLGPKTTESSLQTASSTKKYDDGTWRYDEGTAINDINSELIAFATDRVCEATKPNRETGQLKQISATIDLINTSHALEKIVVFNLLISSLYGPHLDLLEREYKSFFAYDLKTQNEPIPHEKRKILTRNARKPISNKVFHSTIRNYMIYLLNHKPEFIPQFIKRTNHILKIYRIKDVPPSLILESYLYDAPAVIHLIQAKNPDLYIELNQDMFNLVPMGSYGKYVNHSDSIHDDSHENEKNYIPTSITSNQLNNVNSLSSWQPIKLKTNKKMTSKNEYHRVHLFDFLGTALMLILTSKAKYAFLKSSVTFVVEGLRKHHKQLLRHKPLLRTNNSEIALYFDELLMIRTKLISRAKCTNPSTKAHLRFWFDKTMKKYSITRSLLDLSQKSISLARQLIISRMMYEKKISKELKPVLRMY